ncbi:hypothetical protein RJT34_17053 [Clitoria ternatea]|uniref:Exocyst subunit Exo70 family protein n=1 Tax=Clitoria ternatea TaxID=43366 RepID=A0AAN9PE79_CLITE
MARFEIEFRNILTFHTNSTSHLNTQEHQQEQLEKSSGCFRPFRFHASSSVASPKRHHNNDKHEFLRFYGDSSTEIGVVLVALDAINDLRSIAERMISSGYMCQCIEAYATVRKPLIDVTFRTLGINDVWWEQLRVEAKIHRWIEASKVCFNTLFANEKKLCDQIFDGVESMIAEACFMETVKAPPAIQLLNFVDTSCVALTLPPIDLFKILDLYAALENLIPEIDLLFGSESSIPVMASEALSRLAEATRRTLS